MMEKIQITIRDGRKSRDPAQVDEHGNGPVLATAQVDRPADIGDILDLPDGTKVVVIGVDEQISTENWAQTIHIGSIPSPGNA